MKSANGQAKSKDPEEREVRIQGQNSAVAAPLSLMEGYGYPFESSEFAGLSVGVSSLPLNLGSLRLTLVIIGFI